MLEGLKRKIESRESSDSTSFWFLRHAESEGNTLGDTCPVVHDTPLTEKGIEEARKIAEYLKKEGVTITDIYTSPKGRSRETAEIIGKELGIAVKIKDELTERDWGNWGDMKWTDTSERLEHMSFEERYSFVPEGGESWKQMEERLKKGLEEIAEENTAGDNVLIVMHRGGLRATLPLLAKAGIEGHKEFSVRTGALSKFSFDKEDFDFVGFIPSDE